MFADLVASLRADTLTRLLDTIHTLSDDAAADVTDWPSTTDRSLTPRTRHRLERVLDHRA